MKKFSFDIIQASAALVEMFPFTDVKDNGLKKLGSEQGDRAPRDKNYVCRQQKWDDKGSSKRRQTRMLQAEKVGCGKTM